MIKINPKLNGKISIEEPMAYFPHLFDENGKQIAKTFIYSFFDDIIIESLEDLKTIKQKVKKYIQHKTDCLKIEIETATRKLNKLKKMI
ncbi:MAG: hypothetical protein IJ371_05240 [Clostridia bacterium]|nr:hypothetical protein [Clostridia bacterium]